MRRYGHRLDPAHQPIAKALTAAGCSVLSLARLGGGVPDLLVARRGFAWLLEVKGPGTPWKPAQREFAEKWRGCPVLAVATVDEALIAVGICPPSRPG